MAPRQPSEDPVSVEAPSAPEPAAPKAYPTAKYRRVKASEKFPMGYEARRVNNAEEEAHLGPDWKDSPLDR